MKPKNRSHRFGNTKWHAYFLPPPHIFSEISIFSRPAHPVSTQILRPLRLVAQRRVPCRCSVRGRSLRCHSLHPRLRVAGARDAGPSAVAAVGCLCSRSGHPLPTTPGAPHPVLGPCAPPPSASGDRKNGAKECCSTPAIRRRRRPKIFHPPLCSR